ncbi:hypothetical protein OIU76_012901 [Salix suchowensis]|nr:hypothetical protein OIU76_012901 [Salix suchowensis]
MSAALQSCSGHSPVMLRKFDSGAIVIQNKSHSDEEIEVFARIKNLVSKPEVLWTGINASDAAMTMAFDYIDWFLASSLKIFGRFLLCRDISPDGFCFFINPFPEINSDDDTLETPALPSSSSMTYSANSKAIKHLPIKSVELLPSHGIPFKDESVEGQRSWDLFFVDKKGGENRKRVWLGAAILEEESFIRYMSIPENAINNHGTLR